MNVDVQIEQLVIEDAPIDTEAVAGVLDELLQRVAPRLESAPVRWKSTPEVAPGTVEIAWPKEFQKPSTAAVDALAQRLFEALMRGMT